jgi:predicted MFS family arabinose efflux permease
LQESLPAPLGEERRGRLAALREALREPTLGRLLAVFFIVILAFSGMETTFAWWAIDRFGWGPRPIGFVFFYVGLLSAAMQGGAIGPLTRRFGEERLMLCGLVLIALGLLVLPLAREVPPLVIAVTLLALGMGAMQPTLNSLISRLAPPEQQGEVMGVAQSVGALARVLGPIIAGALFSGIGPSSPFFWGALLVALSVLLGWPLLRGAATVTAPVAARPQPPGPGN